MSAILSVFREELRRIFALKPAFSVLIVATVIYAVFYPQPYLNEALRKVPIALVDQDGTTSSREFARRLDATSDVAVAALVPDLPTAEREVQARSVSGIVVLPRAFERDLLHGRPSPVALYADASYFLIYQRVSGAVGSVARTLGAEVEAARLVGMGIDPAIAVAATDPMPLTAVALFNPQGGYATYLLPAAFVLILQQTLLIGVGLLATLAGPVPGRAGGAGGWSGAAADVIGRLLAYLAIEIVILPVYAIVLPYLYGVPRLGSAWSILAFALPFVLSVGAMGLVLAAVCRTALAVQLASAAVGLPLFFLAGFAWPVEAIPPALRLVAELVPSTVAIDGFVRLAQMGARLSDVVPELLVLWGLAVFYGALAVAIRALGPRSAQRSEPVPAAP